MSDFISAHHSYIIDDWTNRVRSLSPARELSRGAIVDHLPQILARIADLVESAHAGEHVSLGPYPLSHAVDRLGRGFDLDQIVTEYGLLRRSILDLWEQRVGTAIDVAEFRHLDVAFDQAIGDSVVRYARARERLLKGIDRVSEAALRTADVDSFLQDLLRATVEGTEAADSCVVLLREDDRLRVRAAVGLEEELRQGFTLHLGEGFAGRVATEGRPIELRHAAEEPLVKSPVIRDKGVRALYGVPMIREGKVIGVAHIGSLTAFEFSDEDKLLFRTMVTRATSGVVKAQLLADVKRAETAQRFLADASKSFAESLDYRETLAQIAHLAVPAIADWCVVEVMEHGQRRRVSVAHADPAKEQLARQLEERDPSESSALSGIPEVIRTGRPEWGFESSPGLKSYIIVPILVREQALGAIALITAESGRRYSESDLAIAEDLAGRAATAIDNARLYAAAQRESAVRERLMAIVSHDLRNLVGVVSMASQLLNRQAQHVEDTRKPMDTISRTIVRMQDLLEDLIDMSAIQAGRISLQTETVPLKAILSEACDAEATVAKGKGVRLRGDLPSADVYVSADRRRILQVLANLLGNAIKFSQSGATITLSAVQRGLEAVITVRDEGPGIPADELDAIFEPYGTIQREGAGGTGLGLYIARGIVQRHGGQMTVESQVGAGSAFSFTLPIAR